MFLKGLDMMIVGVQRDTRYSQCGGYPPRFALTVPTESHFFSHNPPPLFPFFTPFFCPFLWRQAPISLGLPPIVMHTRKLCILPATPQLFDYQGFTRCRYDTDTENFTNCLVL